MRIKDITIHQFKGIDDVVLNDCQRVNALVGKNNSGKSTILHALDLAGLALTLRTWNTFQPKREIRDLFRKIGAFEIGLVYEDGQRVSVRSSPQFEPQLDPQPTDEQRFRALLIEPAAGFALGQQSHRTPRYTMEQISERNFTNVTGLDMMFAYQFYSGRGERGLTQAGYQALIKEILQYFPELDQVVSSRTEDDLATLTYEEYGRTLDILYAGTGLKHFIDVLLKITLSGSPVVLIDEPELGLHPSLQRRFLEYLHSLAKKKNLQIFLATHSPVILNYGEIAAVYRVINEGGVRRAVHVPRDAMHTVLGDLGIRPSDIFNSDICVLVEGQSDVIFFEHVLTRLYQTELADVAVSVVQYGGGAADGVSNGTIAVDNITPAQHHVLWIHDRDAKPSEEPTRSALRFKRAITAARMECHITEQREIEYCFPEAVHVAAQGGDVQKERDARAILGGDQGKKYRTQARAHKLSVPRGKTLRRLLEAHLRDKAQLDAEIRHLVEDTLIPWRNGLVN